MIPEMVLDMLEVVRETVGWRGELLVEQIQALLTDFDEYDWNEMTEQGRINWVEDYLKIV